MATFVPAHSSDTVERMKTAHQDILDTLARYHYTIEEYPDLHGKGQPKGSAAARAYPIQGVLKYHGMSDWNWRIAYMPSISVNNDAAYSVTLVEFDPDFEQDRATINGVLAQGRDLERVAQSLDAVREVAGIKSYAKVWSKNVARATRTGKGLGTSASASAALAMAAIAAAFGPEVVKNTRFLSCMSRLLAGSGCRSAVGGIGLWLSYPGIDHEDSFAIRLDNQDQLKDLCLITVPLDSRINLKTESAHQDAPNSKFFKTWMYNRLDEVHECIAAVRRGDWQTVGQLAELDSIQLHGVTMSGNRENKIFAWEPENIHLFRMCNTLRAEGIPVYFSTDTGPTTVLLTDVDYAPAVMAKIYSLNMGFEAIQGRLAGPATLEDEAQARRELGLTG